MKNQPEEDVFSDRLDLNLWVRVFRHALPYKRLLIRLAISAVAIAMVEATFALVTRLSHSFSTRGNFSIRSTR
jgi:ATP-binding cassette subfamily B protein